MRATMSILGMYNYDNTILDGLTLPENFESGDLEMIKTNLLIETGELEALYPNPAFFKYAVAQWSKKQQLEWYELRKSQLYDYNPIWNADYNIDDTTLETRDLKGTNDTTQNKTDQYTRGLTEMENTTDNTDATTTDTTQEIQNAETEEEIKNHTNVRSGDDTTTNSVYSYNEVSTGTPRDSSKTDYNSRNTENGVTNTIAESTRSINHNSVFDEDKTGSRNLSQAGGTTNTIADRIDNDTTDTGTINTGYHRYLRGNYGVTTTQRMIEEQREVVKFNLFNYIIKQFKERFCVLVY